MMHSQKGYTLIEILIAIFIFSLLSLLSSYSLKRIMDSHHRIKANYNEWQSINHLIHQFQIHTQSFINRPQVTQDHHSFPGFIGQHDYVEWTYTSRPNQTLKRIAYICKGNELIIRHWSQISPKNRRDFQDKKIIKNLSECHFRYMAHNRRLSGYWQNDKHSNPIGIQLTLSWSTYEKLQMWFTFPPYFYDAQ